jgi:serine/threonine-protein kinase
MFRAATGRLPFEGEDWYEIARQHVEDPPPAPRSVNPALSPQFEAVVLSCLSKAPDDRPATGELLADTIQEILQTRRDPSSASTVTVPSTPDSAPAAVGSNSKATPQLVPRRRLLSAAAVATVLVAAIAAVLWLPLGRSAGTTVMPTDSLNADSGAASTGDSTLIFGPDVTPTGSVPPKTTIPGKQGTTPVTNSPFGSIVVNAPPDARITVRNVEIGYGQARRDSLLPGTYIVRAELPAIEGCDQGRQTTQVTVSAGKTHPITFTPRLCGRIDLSAVGRRGDNTNVTGTIWYSLQPDGQPEPPDATLPLSAPRVLPVGKYTLRVKMGGCSTYEEHIEILAGETISRRSIALIC